MTDDRFNELLNGPLQHPFPMFSITRLAMALKCVVDATGEAGEKALEEYCADRQERDESVDDVEDESVDDVEDQMGAD